MQHMDVAVRWWRTMSVCPSVVKHTECTLYVQRGGFPVADAACHLLEHGHAPRGALPKQKLDVAFDVARVGEPRHGVVGDARLARAGVVEAGDEVLLVDDVGFNTTSVCC